ncbi:hypothetical protein JCM8547_008525 [Rhodosporidiobolus lusitaniae]
MVRFALASLGLTAFASFANAASAPDLGSSVSDSICDSYTNGEGSAAVCPVSLTLQIVSLFQGDSVTTQGDNILNSVNSLLTSSGDNQVTDIVKAATNGLASNLIYGVSETLGAIGAEVNNATPQCRCDLSLCYTRLTEASQATAGQTAQATAACAQARYNCATYYSDDDINSVTGCEDYQGTTGDSDSSSSAKRARRSIQFSRE